MESITANMIKQSDIEGRLRLFRYGLVVITVVTFIVGIAIPWAVFRGIGGIEQPSIMSYLPLVAMITVGVGVAMVVIYFAYAQLLKRTVGKNQE